MAGLQVLGRPLQKGFAPSLPPECVSLPPSLCRFMNHRVPSNCRYQPTEYEHAANCATHAVSPCPWEREDGAHPSGDPLRNLKGYPKTSLFSPGAVTESLRAVVTQMCSVCSWGLGCSPSSCPGKLIFISLALPTVAPCPWGSWLWAWWGRIFSKLPEHGLFHSTSCDRCPWGCLGSSGRALSPHQGFFWELTVPTLSPGR